MPTDICENGTNLLTISLNAQSILAKFGNFEAMLHILNDQNIKPDVILVQESRLANDDRLSLIT